MTGTTMTNAAITEFDRALQPAMYAKRGIALVRGQGALLWDAEGNEYIDVMSNYGVNILGHAHPAVTEAISKQAATLLNVHQSFASDVRAEFLKTLLSIAPDGLAQAWLCNSGAEAIEAALKFARVAIGRTNIVAMQRGYHGRTAGAGEATAPKPGDVAGPGAVTHVPFDDLDSLDGAVDGDTAAIIIEPIQGEAGIHLASEGFLTAAAEIARREGALLILDEVQTAFRTGTWFAAEHEGVTPDILCTAKALANGVPIGATLITAAVSDALPAGMHGSTFGGNPLACAAGLATINTIRDEGLLARSVELGERLRAGIAALGSDQIREVRGRGLMTGIDLRGRVTPVLRGLQERGVLALPAGNLTLRMLPPLVVSEAQIDRVVEILGDALEAASRRR
jgi:acetylornithine/LysW-gamma-L-lysine aminotransferase